MAHFFFYTPHTAARGSADGLEYSKVVEMARAEATKPDLKALMTRESCVDFPTSGSGGSAARCMKCPKYEDVDAMIDAYIEYEGEAKGMSRAQCEDAVLRFLQRNALLMEGGADLKDPQTVVTFGLLAILVLGGGYNILVNGLPS